MRPLPLAAALLAAAAPWARAQTRAGVVETGLTSPGIQNGSLSGSLTSGSVPQLLTLHLVSPSLTPSPAFLAAPSLTAAALAAPVAPVALTASVLPTALKLVSPAPYAPQAPENRSVPSLLAPIKALFQRDAPEGLEKVDDARLLQMTKSLAGESSSKDETPFSRTYLRSDKPLPFEPGASAAYADALGYGVSNASRAQALVDASAALLRSAGIEFTRITRDNGGPQESLVITPDRDGSTLNRLAWDLKRRHGASVEYAPARLGYASIASFNHEANALFLPHFGRSNTYAAVLHEAHHSHYAARQSKGDLSPFHASVMAKHGLLIVPRASHYPEYASMEELTGHAKTLKHLLVEMRRKPKTTWWDAYAVDVEAMKLDDLARSANILSGRILTELEQGASVSPLTPGHWALSQLGPLPGGTWHSIMLPWSEFFIPVMDEEPLPRKTGLARLFSRTPETPGQKAARRTGVALKAWVAEAWPVVGSLRSKLAEDEPDWKALDALASKLSLAGPKAEKAFKASR